MRHVALMDKPRFSLHLAAVKRFEIGRGDAVIRNDILKNIRLLKCSISAAVMPVLSLPRKQWNIDGASTRDSAENRRA